MERRKTKHKNDNKHEEDFISDLSDCILLHTLSFLNAKEAVQTCILSKRWINLWNTLPTLTLSSSNFRTCTSFDQFLSQIFSLRDHSSAIRALCLHYNHFMGIRLYKKIIEYTFSHNVQRFRINYNSIQHLPPCFFSSHTLTSLHLSSYSLFRSGSTQIFPNSLNFPALTTLSLERLAFRCGTSDDDGCVDPFSTFNMLNTLIIDLCVILDAQNLRISSTKLLNLTICMYDNDPRKNFRSSFGIELYAPTVHTFEYSGGEYIPKLFGSKSVISSIKHVSIHLLSFRRNKTSILFSWLVELANIESLTANSSALTVKLPSLLCNLKSLKLKLFQPWAHAKLVDFLLQNSPSAKVEFSKSLL
ncbi:F-box/RNI superfamily protein, putative [Medicago truncatula]|uniref:F-box/RNI superfamily protein, putative n=1 Tax=Medicago truncatula TaxID=3880 RepID=G7J082_MEDTR|nr:F-box/RNI superfamily protein, putative [Medicago truncatula]